MRNLNDAEADIVDLDFYYVHDALYNCRALVDEDGVIMERTTYDVYGKQYSIEKIPKVLKPHFSGRLVNFYDYLCRTLCHSCFRLFGRIIICVIKAGQIIFDAENVRLFYA